MNERIYTLAEQAGATRWNDELNGNSIDFSPEQLEQFAESIIKECTGLIRKQSIGEEILGGQRYKTVQLGETIATIEEHFGVEE